MEVKGKGTVKLSRARRIGVLVVRCLVQGDGKMIPEATGDMWWLCRRCAALPFLTRRDARWIHYVPNIGVRSVLCVVLPTIATASLFVGCCFSVPHGEAPYAHPVSSECMGCCSRTKGCLEMHRDASQASKRDILGFQSLPLIQRASSRNRFMS